MVAVPVVHAVLTAATLPRLTILSRATVPTWAHRHALSLGRTGHLAAVNIPALIVAIVAAVVIVTLAVALPRWRMRNRRATAARTVAAPEQVVAKAPPAARSGDAHRAA